MEEIIPTTRTEAAAPACVKVAVAVDGSDNSMAALRTAVRLFGGTAKELHILHARRRVDEFRMDSLFAWRDSFKRMDGQAHSKVQQLLERCCAVVEEECGVRGIAPGSMKVNGVELKGDPRDVLPRRVKELGVSMLVMGSRGNGLLKRITLGSVSTHCLHHASCPILVIPPIKAKATTAVATEAAVVENAKMVKTASDTEEKELDELQQAAEEAMPEMETRLVDVPVVEVAVGEEMGDREKVAVVVELPGALASGA